MIKYVTLAFTESDVFPPFCSLETLSSRIACDRRLIGIADSRIAIDSLGLYARIKDRKSGFHSQYKTKLTVNYNDVVYSSRWPWPNFELIDDNFAKQCARRDIARHFSASSL